MQKSVHMMDIYYSYKKYPISCSERIAMVISYYSTFVLAEHAALHYIYH